MESTKQSNKDWSPSEIDLLITLVRDHSDLYDHSNPGYSNMTVIDKCWRYISERFPNKDAKLCKNKWQVLRGTYRAKRYEYQKIAAGFGARKIKKWVYFDAMSFLEKHITERKTSTNIITDPLAEVNTVEENYSEIKIEPDDTIIHSYLDEESQSKCSDKSQTESRPESQCSADAPISSPKRKRITSSDVDQCFIKYLENKRPKSSIRYFLESLEEDMEKLSPRGLRHFKQAILVSLNKHLEDEGK